MTARGLPCPALPAAGYDTLLATGAAALKAQLSDEDRIFSGSSLTGLSHGRN